MKFNIKTLAIVATIFLASCMLAPEQEVTEATSDLNAQAIVSALLESGLPIEQVTASTAENDENQLLGRPNQYTSKVSFFDKRHPENPNEMERPQGTVAVFATIEDATARKNYIETVTKGVAFLTQYKMLKGKSLTRFDRAMTPDQFGEYEKAIDKIVAK